jgi:Tol biopolymer transport system component
MRPFLLITTIIAIAASSFAATGGLRFTRPGRAAVPGRLPQSLPPVVFQSNRDGNEEIYKMNWDGSAPIRLTFKVSARDRDPRLSPDGGRIVFVSDRDGNAEIYVMNADGSRPVRLTNNPGDDSNPSWSPDGSRIVFGRVTAVGGRYEYHLLIINRDGTGERIIATDGMFPVWSPDGLRIAFLAYDRFPTLITTQIYLMNVDGSGRRRLTTSRTTDANPDWSPDGTRIVFSRNNEIWVMNSDGSGQRRLGTGTQPAWSRDGRRIAFVKGPDDRTQIYVMTPDGSSVTRVIASAGWNYTPDW